MTTDSTGRLISNGEFEDRLAELCLKSGLKGVPRKQRDQHILLKSVVLTLDPLKEFTESEVNDKLAFWLADIARGIELDRVTLRRWLVDEGYLERDSRGLRYRVGEVIPRLFAPGVDEVDVYRVIGVAMKSLQKRKQSYLAVLRKEGRSGRTVLRQAQDE